MKSENKDIKSWKDVWNAPFYYDGYGYIYSGNNVMTFTVDMDRDCESSFISRLVKDMVNVLNDKKVDTNYPKLSIKDGCDLYWEDIIIGAFRGWGYLTGPGGIHLPDEQAVKLQDDMINFVLEKLKG